MSETPYLDSIQNAAMSDQEKATEVRDRLIKDLGKYLNGAHYIDIIVRYSGKDVRIEFDWVKELLK